MRRLITGLVLLNLIVLAAIGLGVWASFAWAMAVCLALGAGAMVLAILRKRHDLHWAVLAAVIAGMFCALYAVRAREMAQGIIVWDVDVHNAPWLDQASGLHFRQGTHVAFDLSGSYSRRSSTWRVAPVFGPEGPDPEVSVWAVCEASDPTVCAEEWKQPYMSGVSAGKLYGEEYGQAIAAAEAAHGLTSLPEAVLIIWSPDPEKAEAVYWRAMKTQWLLWNGIWLVGFLAGWAWLRGRGERTRKRA